jgi:hypothetical protein
MEVAMGPSSERWSGAVRYGLPGLFVGLAAAWAAGAGMARVPEARAQAAPGGEAHGTIAFTSTTPGTSATLLYLIDSRNQSFAIYRIDPLKGSVKLEAARRYRGDLRLDEYNNQPPEVAAVEAMVGSAAAAKGQKR